MGFARPQHQQTEFRGWGGRGKYSRYFSFVDDHDPITDGSQFFQLGRGHHNGHPEVPVAASVRIQDQFFRPDINSTRRFGDEQEFGLQCKGFRQTNLLLVSARQLLRQLVTSLTLYIESFYVFAR